MTAKPPAPPHPAKPAPKRAARLAREAAALRANLRRRKGQQQARADRDTGQRVRESE